jgi:hypothetical protein
MRPPTSLEIVTSSGHRVDGGIPWLDGAAGESVRYDVCPTRVTWINA